MWSAAILAGGGAARFGRRDKGASIVDGSRSAPFVSAAFFAHLRALTGEAGAVVPRTDRGYHPLCAACTRACVEPIACRLADGRLTMTGLFDDVRISVITTEEMRACGDPGTLVASVNTPAEYRGLEALQRHEL
jgi:molybdopterin-guanine dinucleotide biosynthesis protein A